MALPVEIVRPDKGVRESLNDLAYAVFSLFLSAWVVMLLAPHVWKPLGYWHVVAGIMLVRSVIGETADSRLWSRSAR